MKKFYALASMLFALATTVAQNQSSANTSNDVLHDSLRVNGDARVNGYLITKHIKSPDGTIHLGDSSMTFTTFTNQINPIGSTTVTYEGQTTSGSTSGIAIGWSNAALGSKALALGYLSEARGANSVAIAAGGTTYADGAQSTAIGWAVQTFSTSAYAIAMGSGYVGNPMVNKVANSLAVGFNSDVPTFFVGGGAGTTGSIGNVGIGTTSPAQLLHVNGRARFDLSAASSATGRMYLTRGATTNQECLLEFSSIGSTAYDWVLGTYNNGGTANQDWVLSSWNDRAITAMYASGNVSIGNPGTANYVPLAKLHVGGDFIVSTGSATPTSAAYIKNSGGAYSTASTPDYTWYADLTTGIFHPAAGSIAFTNGSSEKMRITSNAIFVDGLTPIYLNSNGDFNHGLQVYGTNTHTVSFAGQQVNGPVLFGYGGGALGTTDGGQKVALLWDNNGRVHIGSNFSNTNHTTAALTVGGDIVGKAMYITNNAWSDFVFDATYKLMDLYEVENFYKQNHHLPQVPSEKEIQEKGNNIAETDAILLQKVEELTLYLVQQQKEIDALKKQNQLLADKINGKK